MAVIVFVEFVAPSWATNSTN